MHQSTWSFTIANFFITLRLYRAPFPQKYISCEISSKNIYRDSITSSTIIYGGHTSRIYGIVPNFNVVSRCSDKSYTGCILSRINPVFYLLLIYNVCNLFYKVIVFYDTFVLYCLIAYSNLCFSVLFLYIDSCRICFDNIG